MRSAASVPARVVAGLLFAAGVSAAGVSAAGCDDDTTPPAPDAAVPDLGGTDFAVVVPGNGRIGDPCTQDSDCGEGLHPVCFRDAIPGLTGAATGGGYCSARCGSSQYDCGGDAQCTFFGFTEPYCFRPCHAPSDCRAGYACLTWMGQICFPSAPLLDCDPSAGDGTCTTRDGLPGGCYRLALGSGMVGRCGARCDIGAGQCAPDPAGAPLRCRAVNDTVLGDGGVTGDRWAGPVCDLATSSPMSGGDCIFGWGLPPRNEASVCADGLDCGAQLDPFGDEECLPVCYLAGGAPAADGGVAPSCPAGTSCHDVFALSSQSDPQKRVGVCDAP